MPEKSGRLPCRSRSLPHFCCKTVLGGDSIEGLRLLLFSFDGGIIAMTTERFVFILLTKDYELLVF